jgi:hypothetical protein
MANLADVPPVVMELEQVLGVHAVDALFYLAKHRAPLPRCPAIRTDRVVKVPVHDVTLAGVSYLIPFMAILADDGDVFHNEMVLSLNPPESS